MSKQPEQAAGDSAGRALPEPLLRRDWWHTAWVWLVPLAALVAAGFYVVKMERSAGPVITVTFSNADGLKAQQTIVACHGVSIGEISTIDLSHDRGHARVQIQLLRADADFAAQGAMYWIVRPEVSLGNISGLNTVVSGPYIDAEPGSGALEKDVAGLDSPPQAPIEGVRIKLVADRLDQLEAGAKVYYRSMAVGRVESVGLADDATRVNVGIVVEKRYRKLVQTNSVFWIISGADVRGSVFSGINVKLTSLPAILTGGLEFATPDDDTGTAVKDGAVFPLASEAKAEWLKWRPKIWVGG